MRPLSFDSNEKLRKVSLTHIKSIININRIIGLQCCNFTIIVSRYAIFEFLFGPWFSSISPAFRTRMDKNKL